MHSLYTLTPLTGREASANRTVVIGTVEFNWRVWMILVWTAPVALLATVTAWPLIGQYAIIMLPLVEGAALWLIHRRTSTGLRLRTYQAINDKRRSNLNQFFLCGHKIDLSEDGFRVLMRNTAPVQPSRGRASGRHRVEEPHTGRADTADTAAVRPAPDHADSLVDSPVKTTSPVLGAVPVDEAAAWFDLDEQTSTGRALATVPTRKAC
ncbi:hypothetical protein [Nocardioides pakistanensis]